MLDENTVRLAYELLIGPKPPNAKQIEKLARSCTNVKQLRTRLMAIPAAQKRLNEGGGQGTSAALLAAPQPEVEVDVPPAQLERLLTHVEGVWRRYGETDAHWSVLTNDRYRQGSLEENKAEFYASGVKDVDRFRWMAARCGVDVTKLHTCVELGSGVGRLSFPLAATFRQVVATDISAAHLAIAAQEGRARGLDNISFRRVASVAELDALPETDAVFTYLSLQHSPPPVIKLVLERLLGRLRPGGIGYFQVPTLILGYQFSVAAYFEETAPKQEMEHHCLPQAVVFDIIERTGCELLECRHDTLSRWNKVSNTFLVRKRPA